MRLRTVLALGILGTATLFGHTQSQATFSCGEGLSAADCSFATEAVRLALRRLNEPVHEWRWVVVPAHRWAKVSQSFNRTTSSPAFTVLDAHVTYIEDVLVFNTQRIDEGLQAYTRRTGADRLRWVLAHEIGHILCNSHSERLAEDVGQRLEAGGLRLRNLTSICRVSH